MINISSNFPLPKSSSSTPPSCASAATSSLFLNDVPIPLRPASATSSFAKGTVSIVTGRTRRYSDTMSPFVPDRASISSILASSSSAPTSPEIAPLLLLPPLNSPKLSALKSPSNKVDIKLDEKIQIQKNTTESNSVKPSKDSKPIKKVLSMEVDEEEDEGDDPAAALENEDDDDDASFVLDEEDLERERNGSISTSISDPESEFSELDDSPAWSRQRKLSGYRKPWSKVSKVPQEGSAATFPTTPGQNDSISSPTESIKAKWNSEEAISPSDLFCKVCSMSFSAMHQLRFHMKSHLKDRPFECEECGQKFSRMHDLKRHERLHTGLKPFVCPNCNRAFSRRDALNRHMRSDKGRTCMRNKRRAREGSVHSPGGDKDHNATSPGMEEYGMGSGHGTLGNEVSSSLPPPPPPSPLFISTNVSITTPPATPSLLSPSVTSATPTTPRKRGRPRLNKTPPSTPVLSIANTIPKKRGRKPRKNSQLPPLNVSVKRSRESENEETLVEEGLFLKKKYTSSNSHSDTPQLESARESFLSTPDTPTPSSRLRMMTPLTTSFPMGTLSEELCNLLMSLKHNSTSSSPPSSPGSSSSLSSTGEMATPSNNHSHSFAALYRRNQFLENRISQMEKDLADLASFKDLTQRLEIKVKELELEKVILREYLPQMKHPDVPKS